MDVPPLGLGTVNCRTVGTAGKLPVHKKNKEESPPVSIGRTSRCRLQENKLPDFEVTTLDIHDRMWAQNAVMICKVKENGSLSERQKSSPAR